MANKMKEDFERELDEIMRTGKRFAIWGAGNEGQKTLEMIRKYTGDSVHPEFIVDNNSAMWDGKDVIGPKEFADRIDNIDIIFICVYVADLVEEQIRDCGFQAEVVPVLQSVINNTWRNELYRRYAKEVSEIKREFSDQRSKDTMDAMVEATNSGDISALKAVNGDARYKLLDKDIIKLSKKESFVDVGAFTGDTIAGFIELCEGYYSSIVGIEPEPGNFKILKSYLADYKNTQAFQIACGNESGELGFNIGKSEGGFLSDIGETLVSVKRLDEMDSDFIRNMSFLKVSALGKDNLVLQGAEKYIKNNKPKIAFYCAAAHTWNIPMYLKEIVPEYRFYLRHYGLGLQALVGYAVL